MASRRPDGDEKMMTPAEQLEQRFESASQDYRKRLLQKAATMRAAVEDGETADERVLAVIELLERLAGNENES